MDTAKCDSINEGCCITLELLIHSEVHGFEDEWAGVTDPAARRKLQNRLNQRACRRRRSVQKQTTRHERLRLPMQINKDSSAAAVTGPPALVQPKAQLQQERDESLAGPSASNTLPESSESSFLELNSGTRSIELDSLPPDVQPTFIPRTVSHHPRMNAFADPVIRENVVFNLDKFEDYPFSMTVTRTDMWHENDQNKEAAMTFVGSDISRLVPKDMYPWCDPWFGSA